ncbi:metal-dependent hydrolase [Salinigranum rubrum]|uniref:Metal-dependent hydrolase n=1 Tax=Salinigranum rubrum TaxID=755307 RepID=A0A2I8VKZ5_9EURY|nr:metal-dependent hydrolase [Salinigranum rubrum]AUV82564.1 metal-dependent hydrolase [Salinigranum rubrum]
MLPWAHAAFGYLLYHVYTTRANSRPAGFAALALVFGTQFPDLVDKPLAWTFGVLPSGRSLGHSVFALLLVCGVLYVLFDESHHRTLLAFALGFASHLVADGVYPAFEGEFAQFGYLFWPLTSAPLSDEGMSFVEFFTTLEPSGWVLFGLGLTAVGLVVWARDGYPGVRDVLLPLVFGREDEVRV